MNTKSKNSNRALCLLLATALIIPVVFASNAASKSLASTLEVYVFPKKGQQPEQQSKDEAECYGWAVDNSGSDPFDLQKQQTEIAKQSAIETQQAQKVGQGAGAQGAVSGAVKGAVIAEIADEDAGKGAAYGAAIGSIRKRRQAAAARQAATAQAEQKAQTSTRATEDQIVKFKKAFSVCLEAKDYLAKY